MFYPAYSNKKPSRIKSGRVNCNFWFNYLATVSAAAVSTATESTTTVVSITAVESTAASSVLVELQAATDKEIAKAKKPNLKEFFIV
jgi:hypothetical protein